MNADDLKELDWRDEDEEELDLVEPVDEDYDPLARFQTPVPTWMLQDNGKPCVSMAKREGLEYTLEFFYGTHTWQEAKRLCAECPNKDECREYALKYGEEGVWGETTYPERRRIKKSQTNNNKENV